MAKTASGKLCETAAMLSTILQSHRRISLRRIAGELNMSERNARRWVEAMAGCHDLRIEAGIVIIESD